MYIILAVSIYVLGVIVYKQWQFARLKLSRSGLVENLLEQFFASDRGGQAADMFLARMKTLHHPLARVLEAGITQAQSAPDQPEILREEIGRVGVRELGKLESHLRGLDLCANLAPLLGLLGMVLSMVTVFSTIETAGARVDVTLLAGGIWEALLTTVFGLIVAVIAQVGYYNLDSRVERVRLAMNDAGIRLVQRLQNQKV